MKYKTFKELCRKTARAKLSVIVDNDEVRFYIGHECVYEDHPNTVLFDALEMLNFEDVEPA